MEEEEEEKEGGAAVARLFNVMMADVLRFTDCHSKLITMKAGTGSGSVSSSLARALRPTGHTAQQSRRYEMQGSL